MRASAYSFAEEVDRQIKEISIEDYLMKKGRAKRLREELYPIARLGLHMKSPGIEIDVEAYEDSGAADGHITQHGYIKTEFDVQVTHVGSYEEALRDELLTTTGYTPGTGLIYRDKKTHKIIAEISSEDTDQPIHDIAKSVVTLYNKKMQMAYINDTVLIIAFDEITLQGRSAWHKLWSVISDGNGISTSKFLAVYLINCATNELQRIA